MHIQKIYCGGKFISTTQPFQVKNPFDSSIVAQTFFASHDHVETAIAAAEHVKAEISFFPSHKKYEILLSISEEIKSVRIEFAKLLAMESGKPIRLALAEIDRAAQTFLVAAEESKRIPKEFISLDWTKPGEHREGLVKYYPIGIIAGISPFNFPLNLAVHKIAPAIACGCPIILKPSSTTPLSTLRLAEIIAKTDLPKGTVSILPMERKTGNQLVTDERFSLLSFTGSPAVGWEMKKNAGKKKVVLELGGNAGVIISLSADIDDAIKKSLTGAFAYSGQICIHAQRFFVHERIFDDFLKKFIVETLKLKFGNPLDEATDISVMIDEENAVRVEKWVQEAVETGAKILSGGKRRDAFFEATILTNTTNKMKVSCEEIFGPVTCVEKFQTIEQAVFMVNDSKFGLQCGIFTNDIKEMDYCFDHIRVGGIILNDMPTVRYDHMPYGGTKESGQGREGVKYAMMDMLEAKILVK